MASTASDTIAAQLAKAQQHYQAGNLLEAEVTYRQIVQQEPHQVEALFWLALLADQAGRKQDSVNYYEQVLALQPNSAEAHGNLGSVLLKVGKVEEAIAHHRRALALMPDNAKARYNLVRTKARSGGNCGWWRLPIGSRRAIHFQLRLRMCDRHWNLFAKMPPSMRLMGIEWQ